MNCDQTTTDAYPDEVTRESPSRNDIRHEVDEMTMEHSEGPAMAISQPDERDFSEQHFAEIPQQDHNCKNGISHLSQSSRKTSYQSIKTNTPDISTPAGQLIQRNAALQNSSDYRTCQICKPCSLNPRSLPRLQGNRSARTITKVPHESAGPGRVKSTTTKIRLNSVAYENQAIKRQKLDGGTSRQILQVRHFALPHKAKPVVAGGSELDTWTFRSEVKLPQERKIYVREQSNPFVSTAELVQKFHSGTRKIEVPNFNKSHSQDDSNSLLQKRPALKLTQPKEPDFQTSQRMRPVNVKSTAEMEEEMMRNMPVFKARPLNKKILEAPKLHAPPRSVPHPPEFQEFHLKTMERAAQHVAVSVSVSSSLSSTNQNHNQNKPLRPREPRTPKLETSLRARPTKVKSTQEMEEEELENMPKFKARPLNRKILESRGVVGIFCSTKPQITAPKEFKFALDERLPTKEVLDLFDNLSLSSESQVEHVHPRITIPDPFHLETEERGEEKRRKFMQEVMERQLEEEKLRIPKANPYPYTTEYPEMPPKPMPKPFTKPEAFQLESLMRHEEEMQRMQEEKERKEREEAQLRMFKARPIMKEDPIPVKEKVRKPLTEVQEFILRVDDRAIDRAEFDKKIIEKETMYKRLREQYEMNQKIEEEKELKQLRRMMVPHARPVPDYANPFIPQRSSKEATKPISPILHVVRRERRITSAAATDMR